MLEFINLPDGKLPPVAPYSHAVRAGDFLFVTDFRYYETVNRIYASYFAAGRYPGRTTVGVTALAGFGDVEIDLIVYCGD